ncbi:ATP-binding protein [Actinophytocola sediminis]
MLAIVLIPSAALLIIGVGASGYLVYDGYQAQNWATTMQDTVEPGTQFAARVEEERRLSLLRLGGDTSVGPDLAQRRAELDEALAGLEALAANLTELNPEALAEGNEAFQQLLGMLPQLRTGIDSGEAPVADVYGYYNSLTEVIKLGLQGLASTAPDPVTAVEESTATALFDVADAMSRGHALAIGAVAGEGLSPEWFQEFSRQIGRYHTVVEGLVPVLTEDLRQRYAALAESPAWQRLVEQESALLLRGPGESTSDDELPMNLAQWQEAASTVNTELLAIYSEHHRYAEGFAADAGQRTFVNSLIGGGVLLLVTIFATLVAIRLSNRVVQRMKNLRAETLELADERLPAIVRRLRNGEQIDIEREVPPLDYGEDELGEVAQAFNKAQRTAVAAAAQEAEIQNGFRTVFLNIAHRSQVVVRRQLEVLDKAEREQEDPEHLESLFQLDHLATRARRNAENLLILGGERPGRRWRNPVPLVEIVRSAIGETEHYKRVHTGKLPEVLMLGSVVADLIHLLAELVDNATAFSPPDARVEVRGNRVGNGVVVEVEDQGVGIPAEEREDINLFLRNPPNFGVMALTEEARLGLFVVSQLSARHGINVTLVNSAYGGVRAIVLVRSALIAAEQGERTPPTMPPARSPRTAQQHADHGMGQNGTGRTGEFRPELPRYQPPDASPLPVPEQRPAPMPAQSIPEPPPEPPVQARPAFPNDLAPPEDIAEQTIRWAVADVTGVSGPARPLTNGIGRMRGRSGPNTAAPTPAPTPAPTAGADQNHHVEDNRPPLPRRRRQANLAPQLTGEAEVPAELTESGQDDSAASAEQARDRMSAFQRGTREGRAAE